MVFEKVRDIIVDQLNVDADEVVMEASFIDTFGADSLDLVEIIMDIEETFDITIDTENEPHTVGELIAFIKANK